MRGVAARLVPGLVLLQLCLNAALAETLEETEALALLQRIAGAARQLNYAGTFIYQHGDQVETSRITHFADASGEYEKLETLDGPKREVLRNNNDIWTFDTERQAVRHERRQQRKGFPALLPDQLSHLTDFYLVRKGEQERIAGYVVQALLLQPRDDYRYGHKLWADVATGLLLKARMLDEKNRLIEQFVFTQLSINDGVTRESVRSSLDTHDWKVEPPNSGPKPGETGWMVKTQAPGFKKIMEMKRFKLGSQTPVAHLVYSDGLAAVSVFIEPLPTTRKFQEGLTHQGAVNIYTRPLPDQLVTVLGEVPALTVTQMANSVSPRVP